MSEKPEQKRSKRLNVELVTEDLCEIYGCDVCPGMISKLDVAIFCTHECHLAIQTHNLPSG